MQDVLDAMFEKKVVAGDYIIQQGDDGDNFYVIEKYVALILTCYLRAFIILLFFNITIMFSVVCFKHLLKLISPMSQS